MKLPNGNQAIVDVTKLREYCLNPLHPVGKHKARVFARALGLTANEADTLQNALQQAAATDDAVPGTQDIYGARYTIDSLIFGPGGQALVRSAWIIRTGETAPRLTTCYVL